MFGCCIKRKIEGKSSRQILDVEEILADYVWQKFLNHNGRFRCCLRRSKFEVEVPMNYLHFETISQKVTERKHLGEDQVPTELGGQREGDGQRAEGPNRGVELKTVFHNGTNNEQTYQFRLEKTRKSTLTVTVQKGFSVGGKAKFNLKLPSVTGGVDFDLKYSNTKINGENIEETATFETSSGINVEKRSKCEAKAIMEEVSVDCDFRMKILMTLLTEGIPVTVKRKKDGKVFYEYVIMNISRVFESYESESVDPYPNLDKLRKGDPSSGQNGNGLVGDKVLFRISGVVQGARLSDQRITLESFPVGPRTEQQNTSGSQEERKEAEMTNEDPHEKTTL